MGMLLGCARCQLPSTGIFGVIPKFNWKKPPCPWEQAEAQASSPVQHQGCSRENPQSRARQALLGDTLSPFGLSVILALCVGAGDAHSLLPASSKTNIPSFPHPTGHIRTPAVNTSDAGTSGLHPLPPRKAGCRFTAPEHHCQGCLHPFPVACTASCCLYPFLLLVPMLQRTGTSAAAVGWCLGGFGRMPPPFLGLPGPGHQMNYKHKVARGTRGYGTGWGLSRQPLRPRAEGDAFLSSNELSSSLYRGNGAFASGWVLGTPQCCHVFMVWWGS